MTYSDDRYGRHSIDLLDFLSSQLAALHAKAEAARENYRKQIAWASASGFMTDYTNVLGGVKFDAFSRHVDGLLDLVDICRREMAAQRAIIEQLAEDARNNNHA